MDVNSGLVALDVGNRNQARDRNIAAQRDLTGAVTGAIGGVTQNVVEEQQKEAVRGWIKDKGGDPRVVDAGHEATLAEVHRLDAEAGQRAYAAVSKHVQETGGGTAPMPGDPAAPAPDSGGAMIPFSQGGVSSPAPAGPAPDWGKIPISAQQSLDEMTQRFTESRDRNARQDKLDALQGKRDDYARGPFQSSYARDEATATAAEKRRLDEENAVASGTGELLAPSVSEESVDRANPDSPNFDPSAGFSNGPPSHDAVTSRFSAAAKTGKPYRPKALATALDSLPPVAKPPAPVDPSEVGLRNAQANEANARATSLRIPQPKPRELRGNKDNGFNTPLSPDEETQFNAWKAQYAPQDSGADYDLRGAFKAGLTPDPQTGHWPDTFKKPNHPTFSNQSIYAVDAPEMAGSWDGEKYTPAKGFRGVADKPAWTGRESAAAALVREDIGHKESQLAKLVDPLTADPSDETAKASIEGLKSEIAALRKRHEELTNGAGGGGAGQGGQPTKEELAKINGSPEHKAYWDAHPEEHAKLLSDMRRAAAPGAK